MEYHGTFRHTLGLIYYIPFIVRIGICYTASHLENQTAAPTLTGSQGLNICIKYLAINPHKTTFYTSSYYYGSNVIRLIWSGNKVEYYTTHNCLECHQDADDDIILNRRRSVSVIIHNLLNVAVFWKVQIQPYVASNSVDGEIICIYKAVKKTKASM